MKKTLSFCSFIGIILLLIACNRNKVTCDTLPNTALYFTTGSGSVSLRYTGYKIEAFKQGSGFKTLDTTLLFTAAHEIKDVGITMTQPYLSTGFDKHDWVFTFYPSGKKFRIMNVMRSSKKNTIVNQQVQEGVKCYNGFSFVLNDVAKTSSNTDVLFKPEYEYVYIQYGVDQ